MAVLTLTLVAIGAAGITACGSGATTSRTTTAPSATTVSSTTSTTAGAPTTASPATTASATTADTATPEDYKAKMSAWVTGPLQSLDTSAFDIPDPANATPEQIDAVAGFVNQAGAVLEQLRAIKPSAEALVPRTQFVKAYEDLLAATDKYVSALRSKDASQLAAIEQAMSTAQVQIQQLVSILAPMIGLTPPSI